MKWFFAKAALFAILTWPLIGAEAPPLRIVQGSGAVEVQEVAPNIVRIHFQPTGKATDRTLMMDPAFQPAGKDVVVEKSGSAQTLRSPEMRVVAGGTPLSVEVQDATGKTLLKLSGTTLTHDENENIWGIKGLDLGDTGLGILRNAGGTVAAGVQGGAGGPFFFTRSYGVLVDSDGGTFEAQDDTIRFQKGSRPDTE
jgi:hypothetical protein